LPALALIYIAGKDPLTAVGGHTTYVRAHALAAVAAGFTPQIFCAGAAAGRSEGELGVVHRVASPLRSLRHPTMVAHRHFLAAAVQRLAAGDPGPHLVHGFGPWSYVGVKACRGLQRRGARAVAVASAYTTLEHDWRAKRAGLGWRGGVRRRLRYEAEYLWIRGVAGRCERTGYAGSRLVLVNYDSVRRLLAEAVGPDVEIRRIPYASEAAFRPEAPARHGAAPTAGDASPAGAPGASSPAALPAPIAGLRPAAAPLVVAVARHDPRKGLDLLLRSLAGLRDEGVPFRACLVGPGTLLEEHRRLAAELGLAGTTAIPGWVDDPGAYLRQADLFVLPSLEEGSGSLALLEALQAGCAVVATRCDGVPEDLVDGESALLVPPGDRPALQAAMRTALGDPDLRRRMARRARATYEARFTPAALTAALAAVYAELGLTP
jgi:glycosyltransferase involved in cell wall biosynthesis